MTKTEMKAAAKIQAANLAEIATKRAAVEADLRSARQRATALRGSLATLQRRTNFSRVSVRIESGGAVKICRRYWRVSASDDFVSCGVERIKVEVWQTLHFGRKIDGHLFSCV